MKQNLIVGQSVDDGSGDYLRKGGLKINNNFDDLYSELGDGSVPFAAGAWKTFKASPTGTTLNAKFGQAFAINTQAARVNVQLPKGTANDYNKVIKLRDVWSTWRLSPITVIPAQGDTLKGSASPKIFNTNFQDLELVYCAPGRWEYIENKTVDKLTNGNLSTVAKKSIIATAGQTDFLNIFDGVDYNEDSLNVYRRGNILYYGETSVMDKANADYGSPGTVAGQLVELNGKDIRLKVPCVEGEVITFETFLDGIGVYRSSYNKLAIQIRDSAQTASQTIPGSMIVDNLATLRRITLDDMGVLPGVGVNPNSLEISLNGKELLEAGTAGLPLFYCEGAEGGYAEDCINNGGQWVNSNQDYRLEFDSTGTNVEAIIFGEAFEDKDLLTVRWFNNNIGTTMDINDIMAETDQVYMNAEQLVTLKNRIEYTNYDEPNQKNMRPVADDVMIKVNNIAAFFDVIYPIGTIYENAHNHANPADYMGFGVWKLYSQGRVTAGWNNDSSDPYFARNNNNLNENGQPSLTAGGTVGDLTFTLGKEHIPELMSRDKVLISDPEHGSVVIGGCQLDPDAQGPGYSKYREDTVAVNNGVVPNDITKIQPTITVYRWIRVG